MKYGDEYAVDIAHGFDPDQLSSASLGQLFRGARRLTRFGSAADRSFIHTPDAEGFGGSMCYRIDADRMLEINEAFLRRPIAIRNRVADVISFQFVSSVKRAEFLGKHKNVHDLGPALIVTAIPGRETTYRLPKTNVPIRHVVIFTTLSTLFERMGEDRARYPGWLLEILDGDHTKPRQRVFFLEEVHRDSIWPCFHLPVSETLLGHWLSAKFDELLCVGLQILKKSQSVRDQRLQEVDLPCGEKIRKARTILNMEYANPPTLPALAQQLGISETQLKSGFKTLNGTTVMQYCISKRIEAAKLLLRENRHSISEIGDIVGYEDHSAFTRAFRRLAGCTPREWRQTHQ